MYDDFWAGYNFGSKPLRTGVDATTKSYSISGQQQAARQKIGRDQKVPTVYNTEKLIRMRGPLGEQGEIYATGKMYIMLATGKGKVRTFPSRPYGIKYMQKKGWVLA